MLPLAFSAKGLKSYLYYYKVTRISVNSIDKRINNCYITNGTSKIIKNRIRYIERRTKWKEKGKTLLNCPVRGY